MKLEKVNYKDLTAKQREQYNFQVVAGRLAEYGFNCIKLSDDWQGKSRAMISRKYHGKHIWMCFPARNATTQRWYLVPHDKLIEIAGEHTPWLESDSWMQGGQYSSARPSIRLLEALSSFEIG